MKTLILFLFLVLSATVFSQSKDAKTYQLESYFGERQRITIDKDFIYLSGHRHFIISTDYVDGFKRYYVREGKC